MSCNLVSKNNLRNLLSATVSISLLLVSLLQPVPGLSQRLGQGDGQNSSSPLYTDSFSARDGVFVRWQTVFESDNLGFNIYAVRSGRRVRLNSEVIPGSVFAAQDSANGLAQSYSWLDHNGTSETIYEIESVDIYGRTRIHDPLQPAVLAPRSDLEVLPSKVQKPLVVHEAGSANMSDYAVNSDFPTAVGSIDEQWAVVAQPALKILVKKDGWYRVTQPQMLAAGFNPGSEIGNLILYTSGKEVAVRTSHRAGPLDAADYLEFYGQGLDTPESDTNVYYLVAGNRAGKRILGDLHTDSNPNPRLVQGRDSLFRFPPTTLFRWVFEFLKGLPANDAVTEQRVEASDEIKSTSAKQNATGAAPKPPRNRKTRARKYSADRQHHHSSAVTAMVAPYFSSTVERKDRLVYFLAVLNGDTENFFGRVVSTTPVTQTITTANPEFAADGPARLEIALQGVNFVNHQVNVALNGTALGSIKFFGHDHPVQAFDVPVSQLLNGANTLLFAQGSAGDTSIVDYVRLTYPRALQADNASLRFSLRSTQSATIDGFTTPNIRLIDYTDPFSVRVTRAVANPNSSGYAITIPQGNARAKSRRLLAIPESQVDQPAGLLLNQPSTLNLNTNGADLLIISHKSLIANAAPLASLREGQGMSVSVIDVEDIYDEFSYGVHTVRAIKDFLLLAATTWIKPPRYVILLGDASYDPRNYMGRGELDFVPTKLVDATYNETASDDWLTDFNNDGSADIPVGRLPVRTAAQADLVISKIVNFSPANVPASALLVADDPTGYYFNFEQANDEVQSLLPGDVTVLRVNRRTDPNAHANVIANLNAGQQLVNYSGHGNVDTWSGTFNSTDATALTNNNKLPFVVVMDCLNGYFHDPTLEGIAEALIKAPNGGAVAAFASSGLTIPDGQHDMSKRLYTLLYGSQPIALGDAVKQAKNATTDIDVRRTWILFGDPSMSIR